MSESDLHYASDKKANWRLIGSAYEIETLLTHFLYPSSPNSVRNDPALDICSLADEYRAVSSRQAANKFKSLMEQGFTNPLNRGMLARLGLTSNISRGGIPPMATTKGMSDNLKKQVKSANAKRANAFSQAEKLRRKASIK